jgi:hypothetical protein
MKTVILMIISDGQEDKGHWSRALRGRGRKDARRGKVQRVLFRKGNFGRHQARKSEQLLNFLFIQDINIYIICTPHSRAAKEKLSAIEGRHGELMKLEQSITEIRGEWIRKNIKVSKVYFGTNLLYLEMQC